MEQNKLLDKVRGSLVGGAVGDALGYPVEFVYSYNRIVGKYGKGGITDYDLHHGWSGKEYARAQFSDDTQMTLYTAEGLLHAAATGTPVIPAITQAYLAWYGLQQGCTVDINYQSTLAQIADINQRRAPGGTCLSALSAISTGNAVYNDSKGCGGIMRVAPIALFGAAHSLPLGDTAQIAGEAAYITHHHPLSTYSSAAFAVIVQQCAALEKVDAEVFRVMVAEAMEVVKEKYGREADSMAKFEAVVEKALMAVNSGLDDPKAIEQLLGEGWVAEESLAISLYCVARHIDNFEDCVVAAVNHGGDSDSTGAIAGNIIGAILGYDAIPAKYTEKLQAGDLLIDMADKLISKTQ